MKKFMFSVLLLLAPPLSFAAVAELQRKVETESVTATTYRHRYDVAFYGPDVPGGLDFAEVSIVTTTSTALATIPGLIAAAARTVATGRGYTVPANKFIMPTYQAQ